jgi:hypothetical protein
MSANSPILGFPLIQPNQNQKETTANTALVAIEAATQETHTYDLSAANVSATVAQFNGFFMHQLNGHTVSRVFTVPNSNKRVFGVLNNGTASVTITVLGGTSIVLPAGFGVLIFSDGTNPLAITNSGLVAGTTADFLGLTDTPNTYAGQGGKVVRVAASEDQVEFYAHGESFAYALTDESSPLTNGQKLVARMPYPFKLTDVRASLTSASTAGGNGAVEINITSNNSSIFSTKPSIDQGERSSVTAAVPMALSTTTIVDDAELVFTITKSGTLASGLKVYLVGHRT